MKQRTRSCDRALLGPRGRGACTAAAHPGALQPARGFARVWLGVAVRIPVAAWLGDGAVSDSGTYGPGTTCKFEKCPARAPMKRTDGLPWQKRGPENCCFTAASSFLSAQTRAGRGKTLF